ncbi:hypothetical protein HRM2_17400 [Desulforapulum autotrophicum HRM2]|uniref:Uncharacterized protein n=1 Tax=Desulforapulum autotrophicum (strain ATCC 43914 / DSM 3382 / VKM B-1955 / HRM2) TaxID=177437 RepID=C0QB47_DESAH|nr:hypothetical protein HRM2_17400 [Desulforapulum autotrophicum HRM2]
MGRSQRVCGCGFGKEDLFCLVIAGWLFWSNIALKCHFCHPQQKRFSAKKLKTLAVNGAPGEIRTHDLLIRSQILYPAELQAPKNL